MTQSLRRGRASDANLVASMASECFQELPDGYSQYDLVRLVENNGKEIGVGPAAMAHYRFLVIRWTQDRDWCEPGERPIVFLRVDRTAEERSLSEARVRQLEYELNEAGLLTWTDRGDYHRSGTRDAQGRILFAHGVDLSPGAVMLPKLLEIDARRRGELKERAGFRARISRLKGYVRPRLARAIENGLTDPDDAGWRNGTEMLKTKTNGATPLERLQEIAMNLSRLGDALNRLFSADSLDGENNDAGCGKARKTCERTRKPIGASIENYRPVYTTRDSKTDKSVTSTSACGQSTACGGETDAPCGAKSSVETVDGREKGEFSLETKQEPRERDNSANAERDRGWGRARTAVDALARNLREGGDAGETGRAKRSNGTCLQSRELGPKPCARNPLNPELSGKGGAAEAAVRGSRIREPGTSVP